MVLPFVGFYSFYGFEFKFYDDKVILVLHLRVYHDKLTSSLFCGIFDGKEVREKNSTY